MTIVLHAHKEFMKVAEQMVTDIVQKHEKEAGTKHAKEMKKEMKKVMKKVIKIRAKGLPHIVGRGGVMVREIAAACDGKVRLPPAKERGSNEVDLPFSC